ncbi:hypothetical protein MKW94_018287 [Papaver nudicaule]|uniref:RING-type domain-containing protein n=1 Tax=Papaver nudicaule TaxID=74823 RepID=A0AA41VRK5_PAPNU|nr:hypothetical protein [Papaver nudicaule]
MPVQKRSPENLMEDYHHQHQQQRYDYYEEKQQKLQQNEEQIQDDSDRTPSSSSGGVKDNFVLVKLSGIRKEVQCPICLGVIRKTRTVMECLHRFCRECIDKSIRLGNNECPACRTHCASRRSLRDDPNYDTLIATLYPDIDEYEEKELAFGDEERIRNKHIQDSIAQTFRRQSSGLGSTHKRRTTAKSVTSFSRRTDQPNSRIGRRRTSEATQSSEDDEHVNGISNGHGNGYANGNRQGGNSSSSDESSMDVKPRKRRRKVRRCSLQPSSASANANTELNDNNGSEDVNKESTEPSTTPEYIRVPEVLVWGKGGTRSHNRHRNLTGGNSLNSRNPGSNSLVNLIDSIHNLKEDNS